MSVSRAAPLSDCTSRFDEMYPVPSSTCDGVVSVVPGRPLARAAPSWAVDGIAVAAGSDPGWVEDSGCAVSDSARRVRRRVNLRMVTFSMAARSVVVTKQVPGEKAQDVACRTSYAGKQRLYTWSVCVPRATATHVTANQD